MSAGTQFNSIPELFEWRVAKTPDKVAFSFPDENENWREITWKQSADRVRAIAGGLRALGLKDEERVSILSSTRIEWILADLGALCACGATTTIYPNSTIDECVFILTDSDTRVVFAENDEQVAKLVNSKAEIPGVTKVVVLAGQAGHDGWVITLQDLEKMGQEWLAANPTTYEEGWKKIRREWLATLIYTSGTTGRPKGVELLHDCWVFIGESVEQMNLLNENDLQYLWLPLSHSFGKMLEVLGMQIGFNTAVDGRIPKLVENLAIVKPTFMAAAPRIFEKVYNKIVTNAQNGGAVKATIFKWALTQGMAASKIRQQRQEPTGFVAMKANLADKLVFHKIRTLFGGRLRFFISGSAPLSREMAEFFHAAGVLILEGYGLTESSAASFVNRPETVTFGTVGPPLPGTEVRIDEKDGEILIKSRGVMRGYRGLPEVTAESLEDGWLRTGDIGELTADGLLKITDRKKDLIKTSGGKYVAPQALEAKLKAQCPYLSQVIVHGNKRNFCTALVTMDPESIMKWASDHGLAGKSYKEVVADEKVKSMVNEAVERTNKDLARYETIKKFAILDEDLSVESGDLTASLKVKRKAVEQKYMKVLDAFYEGAMAD